VVATPVGDVATSVGEVGASVGEVGASVGEVGASVGEVGASVGEGDAALDEDADGCGAIAPIVGDGVDTDVGVAGCVADERTLLSRIAPGTELVADGAGEVVLSGSVPPPPPPPSGGTTWTKALPG
jgi:hypothetical protein